MSTLSIMVAIDSCEWDGALNDRSNHLEEVSLAVVRIVVYLISSENHEVWFLDIQELPNEVYREGVSLTRWQILHSGINCIFAYSDTSAHMRVGELQDLEFTLLPYSQSRSCVWNWPCPAVVYAQLCNRYLWVTVKLERRSH